MVERILMYVVIAIGLGVAINMAVGTYLPKGVAAAIAAVAGVGGGA